MLRQNESRGSILIVDDMPNWCDALSQILERDYHVVCANALPAAERAAEEHTFDLVILDIRLTDADPHNVQGLEFLQQMRNLGDQTEAIILTAYPEVQTIQQALTELAAQNYFIKSPEGGFNHTDLNRFRKSVREAVETSLLRKRASRVEYRDILIVEDEHKWSDLLSQALLTEGYIVEVAQQFQDAQQRIEARKENGKGPYRLAVIDLQLDKNASPDMQEISLLNMLVSQSPGTDIIIVTAFPSLRRVRDAFREYKVWDFFGKEDFDLQDFLQAVRESCDEARERFVVSWFDDVDKGRLLKIGNEYTILVTCQRYRSLAYDCAPIWLPSISKSTRLQIVVYAQDMVIRPSISQFLDIDPGATRAQPLQFRLSPREVGTKQIAIDTYDGNRLLSTLQLRPVKVVETLPEAGYAH